MCSALHRNIANEMPINIDQIIFLGMIVQKNALTVHNKTKMDMNVEEYPSEVFSD